MRYDVVIIGGGLAGISAGCKLQEKGLDTAAVSFGISLHEPDYDSYRKLGGRLFMGDRVIKGSFEDGILKEIFTSNFGNIPLEASHFIIATGKYLAGGLSADMNNVRETTFGLDVNFNADHSKWYNTDFFANQDFMSFGVKVDGEGHPYYKGKLVNNMFAIGEIVSGRDITSPGAMEDIKKEASSIADKI